MGLTKPIDIKRHLQFKKDVDDLINAEIIRHYTSEIALKTGESTGNISNYYNGITPIGDNFLKKFKKAYSRKLKKLREGEGNVQLAVNVGDRPAPKEASDIPPTNTDKAPPYISESQEEFSSDRDKAITDAFAKILASLDRIEQKIDRSKRPPKK